MSKGALNIPFAWLFAIIAGVVILFLAIFISIKLMGTQQTELDAETSEEIGVLLNPLETGFESGKITTLTLPTETRIYNGCNNDGNFGEQTIKVSQKSYNKWSETEINSVFYNKYIFSDSFVEGKKFYVSSMPFNYPFKIADLIIITSKEYCFIDAPEEVEEQISSQENMKITECPEESIKICFEDEDCDINVNSARGYVIKEGEKLYFTENLMYAAIFSDKENYECQTKRLMQRAEELTSLYLDKSEFLREKCDSELDISLLSFKNSARNFEDSGDLMLLDLKVDELKQQNENSECELW